MSGDSFLTRWSRRKRESEEPAPEQGDALPDAPEPMLTEEELAALPKLETIGAETDVTGFLRKGVPALLRNAALRRSWAADPAIRDYVDPARDYAYDWNVPGGVPGTGPLEADIDVKAMTERLFSGPTADAPASAAEVRPEPDDPGPADDRVAEAEPLASPQPGSTAGDPPSEPFGEASPPRRHGGATPV